MAPRVSFARTPENPVARHNTELGDPAIETSEWPVLMLTSMPGHWPEARCRLHFFGELANGFIPLIEQHQISSGAPLRRQIDAPSRIIDAVDEVVNLSIGHHGK